MESVKINSKLSKFNFLFLMLLLVFSGLCGTSYIIIALAKDLLLYFDGKPLEREMPFKSQ